jgi:hypothetical protein
MLKKLFDRYAPKPVTTNIVAMPVLPALPETVISSVPVNLPAPTKMLPASLVQYQPAGITSLNMAGAIIGTGLGAIYPGYVTTNYQSSYNTRMVSEKDHIKFINSAGVEIVRLNNNGSVVWANGIVPDEAIDSFRSSLEIAAEQKVGIHMGTKHRMRDSVFKDLIEVARDKGPLSAEDLTYLLEASKIVERLKI